MIGLRQFPGFADNLMSFLKCILIILIFQKDIIIS